VGKKVVKVKIVLTEGREAGSAFSTALLRRNKMLDEHQLTAYVALHNDRRCIKSPVEKGDSP